MFKKCKKNEPARLTKKEKNDFIQNIKEECKFITCLLKTPEFWVIIIFVLLFTMAILFAMHESISYLVYNRGL